MTATIITLPGCENNPDLVMQKRLAYLDRPEVKANVAKLDAMLADYTAERRAQQTVNGIDDLVATTR